MKSWFDAGLMSVKWLDNWDKLLTAADFFRPKFAIRPRRSTKI